MSGTASRAAVSIALVLGISVCASGVALAADDEVVAATARPKLPTEAELAKAKLEAAAKPATPATTTALTTEQQIALWHANAPKVGHTDDEADDDIMGPRKMHGEASVSVGTGGYRSVYMSALYPVGENGTLGIAVSQTDFGKNGAYIGGYDGGYYGGAYPYSYGPGYGYGPGRGYGYGRVRGGTSQSIAISLDMSGDKKGKSDTPEGCAPGFRNGDRYMEPLWVTEMRGRTCEVTTSTTTTIRP